LPCAVECRKNFNAWLGCYPAALAMTRNARPRRTADRDRVNVFHARLATKQFGSRTTPFSRLGENVLKRRSDPLNHAIKQRGSILWASILNSIYREILRTSLSGMHKLAAA
jgi:hypothetical protein